MPSVVVDPMDTFLGLDFSTQQLKAVITDASLKHVLHTFCVNYDERLPEFGTTNGVCNHSDGVTVTAPTLMWVKALDLLLHDMKAGGVDFGRIRGLSGAGQQHGSVYWRAGSREILRSLEPGISLHDQLQNAFSITDSPIWMDASTGLQCRNLENAVGGAKKLVKLTGSRAYHRFTGPQIAKLHQTRPADLENTERISLVSSFGCSLFLGDYAPIDWSDGSGMNFLDIQAREWNQACLDYCAPDLRSKLDNPVASSTAVGKVSPYYAARYGFNPDCSVIAFTGDNPASMAGINQQVEDIAISLGTSDTCFLFLHSLSTCLNAATLCNPIDKDAYMAMICFKNGSISRERVRKQCGCQTWEEFTKLLRKTDPGNSGNIGFYYDFPEILPNVRAGNHRFDGSKQQVCDFPPEVEARAVLESQCLRKRFHAEEMGIQGLKRALVTGGASVNPEILQMLADVFNCDVYTQDLQHSAALGSAYRAKHGLLVDEPFARVCEGVVNFTLACRPHPDAAKVYNEMLPRYVELERRVAAEAAQSD